MLRLHVAFIAAVMFLARPLVAEELPRTVTASGESVVYVAPDEVIVRLGVETFHASLENTKAANDSACGTLLRAIKAMNVEDKNVQTSQLDLEIKYVDYGHPARGIEGYYARRYYSITLKDTKQLEKLIDSALKSGANRLLGVEFRTTELRKHRDEARKMAIKAAAEKAAALAAELRCKTGTPRTITENPEGSYYGGGYWGMNSYQAMAQNSAQSVGGGGEGGDTLPLGQIGVRAHVSVTFDLVPIP